VLDHFAQFGYNIPFGVSIADYILDVSLGEAGYSSTGKTGNAAVQELWTVYEGSTRYSPAAAAAVEGKQLEEVQLADHKRRYLSGQAPLQGKILIMDDAGSSSSTPRTPASRAVTAGNSRDPSSHSMKGKHEQHQGAAYWQQLQVLFQRSGRVRRFEQMTGQHFFQLFAVAFITGGWVDAGWVMNWGINGTMCIAMYGCLVCIAICVLACWTSRFTFVCMPYLM
jgi:hypothetical protein